MGLKVRYRGSLASVGLLDELLRDEGLQVDHRQLVEPSGSQQDLVDVVLYVADPVVDGERSTPLEKIIKPKIENALAKLRMSVPRGGGGDRRHQRGATARPSVIDRAPVDVGRSPDVSRGGGWRGDG